MLNQWCKRDTIGQVFLQYSETISGYRYNQNKKTAQAKQALEENPVYQQLLKRYGVGRYGRPLDTTELYIKHALSGTLIGGALGASIAVTYFYRLAILTFLQNLQQNNSW